jgi:hypothetical protein
LTHFESIAKRVKSLLVISVHLDALGIHLLLLSNASNFVAFAALQITVDEVPDGEGLDLDEEVPDLDEEVPDGEGPDLDEEGPEDEGPEGEGVILKCSPILEDEGPLCSSIL